MRHYLAMQIRSGPNAGKWHYCQETRDGGVPVGLCSPWELCGLCLKTHGKVWDASETDDCPVCHGKRRVDRAEPCPGHDTPEAAQEHYRQHLLDGARYATESDEARAKVSQPHKCEAVLEGDPEARYSDDPVKRATVKRCGAFTCGSATVGPYAFHFLCPAHCSREFLAPLVRVGESWES